jgi:hypothetical protein
VNDIQFKATITPEKLIQDVQGQIKRERLKKLQEELKKKSDTAMQAKQAYINAAREEQEAAEDYVQLQADLDREVA